jgi:hypothetical protein
VSILCGTTPGYHYFQRDHAERELIRFVRDPAGSCTLLDRLARVRGILDPRTSLPY